MMFFDLERFVRERVTGRGESLLAQDLARYGGQLEERLAERRVLVIGGAGSIGASFIKATLRFPVAKLVVVDNNENGLTELVRDVRSTAGLRVPEMITYPVNFADRVFGKIMAAHGPFEVVANFAAHKHVRSEKDVFSIEAMLENNVLRAHELMERLAVRTPEHFFCVSTDKAANPVNVMGASKKLMEELILAYKEVMPVTTARFANVAFSNGSLPQGFLERLRRFQPWSCPVGIRRFFVSPQEAGELCLLAAMLGESGDIVFPKLDEERDMIGFDKVAHELLRELGMEADECGSEEEARERAAAIREEYARSGKRPERWPVVFFESDTSGEKSFEEFYTAEEELELERFANLGVVKGAGRRELAEIEGMLAELRGMLGQERATKGGIVEVLRGYLPNFEHIERGRGLDERM